jgi:acyl carrier protein
MGPQSIRRLFSFRPDLLTFIEASVKQLLRSHAIMHLPPFSVDARFADLGIESLEQTRLVTTVERHFGIELTTKEFLELGTVLDLVSAVNRHIAAEYLIEKREENDLQGPLDS